MTDAIISVVVEQLASFLLQEVKLVVNVREDVKTLTSTLKMVQAVLRDAETRQIKEEAVKLWLEKLKVIVYDAEDVLDEWNTRNHCSRLKGVEDGGVRIHKKVLSYLLPALCFSTRSVVVRYKFGSRIKEIRESLDVVNHDKQQLGLNINHPSHEEPRDDRQTSSMIDVSIIYGRDHDKNVIVSLLSGESSAQVMNTNVISIVGTGGFGKTTLAKLVLADGKVEEIFEERIFVCVSEPFQLLEIASSIIQQIIKKSPGVTEREPVLKCLCENLNGKRFLIVLDDVWTENTNDWDPLKLAFDGGAQGSRVIVTTRNKKVAEMMHSSYTHNLDKLSDRDSWLLFEQITFKGREEELLKFEEIGKKIAAKCKGVPLAIKIVGGLMRSMKTKNEWNHVLTSEIWGIEEIEKRISPSFFLSYNPLPSKLKQCFMYCAIFPKDTRLYKDKLVKLWMAQGFLGSDGHKNLEKTGYNYFDDLAMHSFFQDFEKGPEGNITSCKMHDLVHDFALFLTRGECSFLEDGKELDGINVRHLVTARVENSSIYMAKNLRTLLITQSVNSDQLIKIFNQLKRIRILDLSSSQIEELPTQVKELLHLRYLDLSTTKLVELPETICDLYNLQTLKLNRCYQLIKLPVGIGKLLNLRHLELDGNSLSCLPQGIGRLRFLRSLCKFIVGDATNGCNIKELKDLCYLEGSLEIVGLERVVDASEAAQAELKNKKSIVVLSLEFERLEEGESENMTGVLENLQPHEDVEELNIYCFSGSRFPSWISMLANLLRLELSECDYTTKLPALGNLPSLEDLSISKLPSIKQVGFEFLGISAADGCSMDVAFPKLKVLEIYQMNELVEWELPIARDNKKIMPCLRQLTLWKCPMLRALPGLGTLESLESLTIYKLPMIKQVGLEFLGISGGDEFYGFDDDNNTSNLGAMAVAFPKLKKLKIERMNELVEWELPIARDNKKIMPCLIELELSDCPMLRALPGFGTLELLEDLSISKLPSIKQVGFEFLGISAADGCSMDVAFPKLMVLRIEEMKELVEWELPIARDNKKIMPCLSKLKLLDCPMLSALPGLGTLESLESLHLEGLPMIKQVGLEFLGISGGDEFYGFDDDNNTSNLGAMAVAFPKLKKLKIERMNELVEWELPIARDNKKIMPCLIELELSDCPMLRALPGFGTLESLEDLSISKLPSIKQVGFEFLGISAADGCSMDVAFPKLMVLRIEEMKELVEWELPIARDNKKIMPCLSKLKLLDCPMLSALPGLGTLESLESLHVEGLPMIKQVGLEFLGISGGDEFYGFDDDNNTSNLGAMAVAFPKLKKLKIERMNELVEWELPIARDNKKIMPCLIELELSDCPMLRALPGFGTLESLEDLSISKLPSIKQVGFEFLGISAADGCSMDVAFPKLMVLRIEEMKELVEWELPIARDNKKIMPCLSKLKLLDCPMLSALPGLGTLESLESLHVEGLPMIKQVGLEFLGISGGDEFYGFDDDNNTSNLGAMAVAFPKLKKLKIEEMNELVEWELPIARDNKKIMPCLSVLELRRCPMLRALPGLGTLESLEILSISGLHMIKQVGLEFLGISAADEFGGGGGEKEPVILFPKLTRLEFRNMDEWEVWILPPFQEDIQIMPRLKELNFRWCKKLRALQYLTRFKSLDILYIFGLWGLVELEREEGISFLPCLRELTLCKCTSLRVIPGYLFPHTLRELEISNCPQLRGVQPCLPPLLEYLNLREDVGVFSESLPIAEEEENNNYPNLKKVEICFSKHPSLPKGFSNLTAIQHLEFKYCESLDFDLNELKHLTMLQHLYSDECPILAKRFQSSGDDWMTILSHVPNIQIGNKNIKGRYYWR